MRKDFTRADYGVDLGGYIVKDRLWFFAAYNKIDNENQQEVTKSFDLAGAPAEGDEFTATTDSDLYAAKLTWRMAANHSLSGSYFADPTTNDGILAGVSFAATPLHFVGAVDTGGNNWSINYDGIFGQNVVISANSFVQLAGVTALQECDSYVAEMRTEYDRRRRHLIPRLEELGLKVHTHTVGACHVLADARHISHDSLGLAREILEETGVALTPGIDFGKGAEGFLRFSYANSMKNLDTAVDRLKVFFQERGWL